MLIYSVSPSSTRSRHRCCTSISKKHRKVVLKGSEGGEVGSIAPFSGSGSDRQVEMPSSNQRHSLLTSLFHVLKESAWSSLIPSLVLFSIVPCSRLFIKPFYSGVNLKNIKVTHFKCTVQRASVNLCCYVTFTIIQF